MLTNLDLEPVVSRSSKHHGLALWPAPTNDPRDPLRWPRWLKIVAILSTSLFNFSANFAGAGPSVATPLFEQQFERSASDVNGILTVSMVCTF